MPIELFCSVSLQNCSLTRWCFSQMVVLLLLRGLYKDLSSLHKEISSLVIQGAHRRTGRGARGNAAPPNFGQLRFFGQQEKIWAKPVFKKGRFFFFFFIVVLKRYIFSILT